MSQAITAARQVRILQLGAGALRALADGDLVAANLHSPVALTPYFAGPHWSSVWRMRSEQVVSDPASADWITGVVWCEELAVAVGRAGFHGPPDGAGMVEVGYAIDPAHRRRGYARAALELMLGRAAHDPRVRTVRASIGPANLASRNLVLQYGFVEVGEQRDDDDGLEVVYEVSSATFRA
ncbi:GNAT family N-acetyltransferase [Jiangella asiatica]|uniref:N-acetyltransferase n=1 Tax=Jiangella asiatica TaxID=2530372 RepID=A0A4R5DNG7_9ACTN|nr:GNAT family N-acetyltransferase [Jiangella asiatica]TDE15097.1 N-acetyltransferase [Jiangella asiatica]